MKTSLWTFAALLLASWPGPLRAAPYRLCGPFTFTQAAPSAQCSLSALPPGADFLLLVRNGRPDGTRRASSAEVTFAGQAVAGPSEFNQNLTAVISPVAPALENAIAAALTGPADAELEIELVDNNAACFALAPQVVSGVPAVFSFAWDNPEARGEFQLINTDRSGSRAASSGHVYLNGPEILGPQELNQKVTGVLKPAALLASNTLSGAVSNGAAMVQVVDRDETAPAVAVTSHVDGECVAEAVVAVAGTVSDASAAVTVNGVAAAVSAGAFSATISLAAGTNTVEVRAADVCGNASTATLTLRRDTTAPLVAIEQPADGLVTNEPAQLARAVYSDAGCGLSLPSFAFTVDGENLTSAFAVGAASAEASLTFAEGAHELFASIDDAVGNTGAAAASLLVDLTPPAVAFLSPPPDSLTNVVAASVDLSYDDTLAGVDPSSLRLFVNGVDRTAFLLIGADRASGTVPLAEGANTFEASRPSACGMSARGAWEDGA